MFVFYFGIVADITPPVALAAYAGAGIAKANAFWTGVTSTKLAIGAFLTPYIFVYNTSMLWIDTTWYAILQTLITSCAGMTAIGAAMIGYFVAPMSWIERILFVSRRAAARRSGHDDRHHRYWHAGRVRGLPVSKEKIRGRQHGHRCGRVNENS